MISGSLSNGSLGELGGGGAGELLRGFGRAICLVS